MIIAIGVISIIVLFCIGTSIWMALSVGSVVMLMLLSMTTTMAPIIMLSSVDSFVLLAIPLFVIAGNVMAQGGLSPYLFAVVNSFLGRIKGGIAFSTIAVCVIYGAICGSTTATLAGASSICVPNMLKAGYTKRFTAGVISVSATLGQMIPPSIFMIVYGSIVSENVGKLFLSGIIPGLICAVAIGIVAYFKSPPVDKMNGSFAPETFSWHNRGRVIVKGFPALLMPVIILGSIYAGVVTPTEAAAVACVYGVLVCVFGYRSMNLKVISKALGDSVSMTAVVFVLVASAYLFALPLTILQIPQTVSQAVANAGLSGTSLIFAVTIVFLVMGCFLDSMPIMILVMPIIYPALLQGGVNLIHFNVITILAMQIGQVTPPFGISLYLTSKMVGCPIEQLMKETVPYLFALIIVLVILILFPQLSLLLPSLM